MDVDTVTDVNTDVLIVPSVTNPTYCVSAVSVDPLEDADFLTPLEVKYERAQWYSNN